MIENSAPRPQLYQQVRSLAGSGLSQCLLKYTVHPFRWLISFWQISRVWVESNWRSLTLVCPKGMHLLFLSELLEQTQDRHLPGSPVVVYLRLPLHHQPLVLPLATDCSQPIHQPDVNQQHSPVSSLHRLKGLWSCSWFSYHCFLYDAAGNDLKLAWLMV